MEQNEQHADILGKNYWETVPYMAAPGMHSLLSGFSGCLPCDWAVRTYSFAPQVGASLQDVSVHRMDPDSWGKHVWKTVAMLLQMLVFLFCVVVVVLGFFFHFK